MWICSANVFAESTESRYFYGSPPPKKKLYNWPKATTKHILKCAVPEIMHSKHSTPPPPPREGNGTSKGRGWLFEVFFRELHVKLEGYLKNSSCSIEQATCISYFVVNGLLTQELLFSSTIFFLSGLNAWHYQMCFAQCLYHHRDDMTKKLFKTTAQECRMFTSSWHASLKNVIS